MRSANTRGPGVTSSNSVLKSWRSRPIGSASALLARRTSLLWPSDAGGAVRAEDDLLVAADQLERVDLLVCVVGRHKGRDDFVGSVADQIWADALPDDVRV